MKSSNDVARCASPKKLNKPNERKKNNKKRKLPVYWPSVPLCVALQLYRITLFTGGTGEAPLCVTADNVPVQINHIKTHKSSSLTFWSGVKGAEGGLSKSRGLNYSSFIT